MIKESYIENIAWKIMVAAQGDEDYIRSLTAEEILSWGEYDDEWNAIKSDEVVAILEYINFGLNLGWEMPELEFDVYENYMDDDICEEIHMELDIRNKWEMLSVYKEKFEAEYGEEFVIN